MFALQFEGWAQCLPAHSCHSAVSVSNSTQLITDPGRDIHGNRRLEFQRRTCPDELLETFGNGVRITSGFQIDRHTGMSIPLEDSSPLFGAAVDLLDNPVFHPAGFLLIGGGYGSVWPLHLQLRGRGITIDRQLAMAPEDRMHCRMDLSAGGFVEASAKRTVVRPHFGPDIHTVCRCPLNSPAATVNRWSVCPEHAWTLDLSFNSSVDKPDFIHVTGGVILSGIDDFVQPAR